MRGDRIGRGVPHERGGRLGFVLAFFSGLALPTAVAAFLARTPTAPLTEPPSRILITVR